MPTVADTVWGIVEGIDPEAAEKSRQVAAAMRAKDAGQPVPRVSGLPGSVFDAAHSVRQTANDGRMSSTSLLNAVGRAAPSLVGLAEGSKAHGGAILANSPELQSSLGGCFPSGEKGIDMETALSSLASAGLQSLPPQVQAAMQMAQLVAQATSAIVAAIEFPHFAPTGSGFIVEGQEVACALDPTEHPAVLTPGLGCPTVLYKGRPVWRVGLDVSKCAVPTHPPGFVQQGAKKTTIGGQAVARKLDIVQEGTPLKAPLPKIPKLSSAIPPITEITAEAMLQGAAQATASQLATSTISPPTPTPSPVPGPTPSPSSSTRGSVQAEDSLISQFAARFGNAMYEGVKAGVWGALAGGLIGAAAALVIFGAPAVGAAAVAGAILGFDSGFAKGAVFEAISSAFKDAGFLDDAGVSLAKGLTDLALLGVKTGPDLLKKAGTYEKAAQKAAQEFKALRDASRAAADDFVPARLLLDSIRQAEQSALSIGQRLARKEFQALLEQRLKLIDGMRKQIQKLLAVPGPQNIPNGVIVGSAGSPGGKATGNAKRQPKDSAHKSQSHKPANSNKGSTQPPDPSSKTDKGPSITWAPSGAEQEEARAQYDAAKQAALEHAAQTGSNIKTIDSPYVQGYQVTHPDGSVEQGVLQGGKFKLSNHGPETEDGPQQ